MKPARACSSARKPSVSRCITAFVCLAVLFLLGETGISQTGGKEQPTDLTMLELVSVGTTNNFQLVFMGHDFDPKRPDDITVQINRVQSRRTYFLRRGQDIPDTKFTFKSFKQIEVPAKNGGTMDTSEVIIVNKATGAEVVLVFRKPVGLGDTIRFAVFRYKGVQPGGKPMPNFAKHPGDTFTLPADHTKTCKVIDINEREAVIELPDGTRKTLTVSK